MCQKYDNLISGPTLQVHSVPGNVRICARMQTINYRDCILLENVKVSFWREYAEALNLDYIA
jgi:hypothetical protein